MTSEFLRSICPYTPEQSPGDTSETVLRGIPHTTRGQNSQKIQNQK